MVHLLDTSLVRPLDRRRRRRHSLWLCRALIFAAVVVLVDALVGESGLAKTVRARREYSLTAARLSALQVENAGLMEQARRLAEDPRAIEAIAREELGLIRAGEMLFVLKTVR